MVFKMSETKKFIFIKTEHRDIKDLVDCLGDVLYARDVFTLNEQALRLGVDDVDVVTPPLDENSDAVNQLKKDSKYIMKEYQD